MCSLFLYNTIYTVKTTVLYKTKEKKAKIGEVIAERDGDVGVNVGVKCRCKMSEMAVFLWYQDRNKRSYNR